MWMLSPDAGTLLSAVKFNPNKAPSMARRHGALDPEVHYILVRARVPQSLRYVCDVLDAMFLGEREGYERPIVDEDKTADYHYRTVITLEEWKRFLLFEADGIDYDSHVKEETVKRQPEPKIGNLMTALSATWSAWSKLQPNAPYATAAWANKPDCKNCNHKELDHTVKGDSCHGPYVRWDSGTKQTVYAGCSCKNYEPKPKPKEKPKGPAPLCANELCGHAKTAHYDSAYSACSTVGCRCQGFMYRDGDKPAATGSGSVATRKPDCTCGHGWTSHGLHCYRWDCQCPKYTAKSAGEDEGGVQQLDPPLKSAQDSAAVFMEEGSWDSYAPSVYTGAGSEDDYSPVRISYAETPVEHEDWCTWWDGDICLCTHAEGCSSLWDGECDCGVDEASNILITEPDARHADEERQDGIWIGEEWVKQDPPVPGESAKAKKNRLARNRRARRKARVRQRILT